jgi:hypothetical protein
MQYIEITAETKLKYCPLPAHEEMAKYTHLELSNRPYKYKKGMTKIEVDKQSNNIIVDKKSVFEFKVVV